MSDVLTPSQIKVPGTATSKDDAIRGGRPDPGRRRRGHRRLRRRDVRAREVGVHLHGQLPGHPARHQRGQGRDQSGRRCPSSATTTPIDWDGNEVRFAVGIAGVNNGHLEILGKIAIIFSDMDEVDKLIAAGSADEVYELLNAVNED